VDFIIGKERKKACLTSSGDTSREASDSIVEKKEAAGFRLAEPCWASSVLMFPLIFKPFFPSGFLWGKNFIFTPKLNTEEKTLPPPPCSLRRGQKGSQLLRSKDTGCVAVT
jgi:hypothetical protein